ncbi:MAG: hypothetical protein M3Q31_01465 [Actinomycetota bacterium]|nr:hypothetical protein [Actinomycetota bacterium]
MRERAQASVETIALLAAVMALGAALMLGVAQLGPPLAGSIGDALSGAFGPGAATAPGLDPYERLLVASATSPDPDGATLLDLRTNLRARLSPKSADAAFAATLHPLVVRALSAASIAGAPGDITVIDRGAEDSWLRERFHPGALSRFKEFAVSIAGKPGAIATLFHDVGLGSDEADGIEPGHAAGDLVVEVDDGLREVVMRRRPGMGLTVVAEQARLSITGGTQR